ncbi:MAG: sulfatase-like hydrolase/transferase [Anaerolineales bacterium]
MASQGAFRSMLVSVAITLGLLLMVRLVVREWEKAALITSMALLLFFSYGHLYRVIRHEDLFGIVIGRHRYIIILWLLILSIWSWFVVKKVRRADLWNATFSLVAGVAVILPLIGLVQSELKPGFDLESRQEFKPLQQPSNIELNNNVNDIYYIILDGYGREDVLRDIYGFDNSEFIRFLDDEGFYIADESKSNYIQTALSLASSLNMEYVNYLADSLGEESFNRDPLNQLIQNNRVMRYMDQQGYNLVAFDTGHEATSLRDVDVFLSSEEHSAFLPDWLTLKRIVPFEELLLETTAVVGVLDRIKIAEEAYFKNVVDPLYQAQRNRTLFILDNLADIPETEGPNFIFAHIVAPHPPFVFGPDGEARNPGASFTYHDGSDFLEAVGTREEYIEGYRDQLVFLNKQLERTIDDILSNSDRPPIIILQADHGPGAYLNWQSLSKTNIDERTSILNAYYWPEVEDGYLYPSISPVNSFRVLLNAYFQENYELLDDRTYFSPSNRPYLFTEVK